MATLVTNDLEALVHIVATELEAWGGGLEVSDLTQH